MSLLEECHRRLAKLIGPSVEPIEVWRCAEEHRAYWRPNQVRVLLLAESHVYTRLSELSHRITLSATRHDDMPRGFVRLVYCLGYGENGLLSRPISRPSNSGTGQFWKVFYSCVNQVAGNEDFRPVQGGTPFSERIENKLGLLRGLREAGVWLVDASLAALYPKLKPSVVNACLQTSWDCYVGEIIAAARPSQIICIGTGVARSLRASLDDLGVPVAVVPAPNARLSTEEHLRGFRKYHEIVSQTAREQGLSETGGLCEMVSVVPAGASSRSWTLRVDNHSHVHGVVRISESPLYLELSCCPVAGGQEKRVGLFKLDLAGLLRGRYIRHDPVKSVGPMLRLRIVRSSERLFSIQARNDGPGLLMGASMGREYEG